MYVVCVCVCARVCVCACVHVCVWMCVCGCVRALRVCVRVFLFVVILHCITPNYYSFRCLWCTVRTNPGMAKKKKTQIEVWYFKGRGGWGSGGIKKHQLHTNPHWRNRQSPALSRYPPWVVDTHGTGGTSIGKKPASNVSSSSSAPRYSFITTGCG